MLVFSQQQIKTATTMQLGDSVLEEKMSYKYLGLEVEKDWKWKQTKAVGEGEKKNGDSVCVGYPETGAVGEGSSPCVGGVSVAIGVCVENLG